MSAVDLFARPPVARTVREVELEVVVRALLAALESPEPGRSVDLPALLERARKAVA